MHLYVWLNTQVSLLQIHMYIAYCMRSKKKVHFKIPCVLFKEKKRYTKLPQTTQPHNKCLNDLLFALTDR
jgi:heme exporter protein D